MTHKEQLTSLLGLPNSSTDEEIAIANSSFQKDMVSYKDDMDTAIANARELAVAAHARTSASNERIVALQNSQAGLLEELANRDVEVFKSVIADPAAIKESLMSNRAATVKLLNGLKAQAPAPAQPASINAPLHNSKAASQPAPISGGTPTDIANAKWVSNRANQLQKTIKGLGHRDAFQMARTEFAASVGK